jgi:hypothetical protein
MTFSTVSKRRGDWIPSPKRGRLGWGLLIDPARSKLKTNNNEYRTRNFEFEHTKAGFLPLLGEG